MRSIKGRELKALFILSIVAPMSFLVSLRLTGVMQEPPEPETITLEPVSWQIDRPSMTVEFYNNPKVENTYTNDKVSVGTGVQIFSYEEDSSTPPFEGRDGVQLQVCVHATIESGFSTSLAIKFYPNDSNAIIFFMDRTWGLVNHNVTVTHWKYWGTNNSEAFLLATMTNSSGYLSIAANWVFLDEDLEDHQLKVVTEFAYRNTSIHEIIILPLLLNVVQDAGETFDTAINITSGEHLYCLDNIDSSDIFAIMVQAGQILNITMIPPKDANYSLYLYNSTFDMVAESTQPNNISENIVYTTNKTETYYIIAKSEYWQGHPMEGAYNLSIEVLNREEATG